MLFQKDINISCDREGKGMAGKTSHKGCRAADGHKEMLRGSTSDSLHWTGSVEVIKQLKSWLSLNPVVGCPAECGYCYRHDDDIFFVRKPTVIRSTEGTLNDLLDHSFFVRDSTPIAIGNMATDPFLKGSKAVTFDLLKGLDGLGCSNSVGLITKRPVSKGDMDFLESLSHLDVIVFVTYSEMPRKIEPIGNEKRRKTLRELSRSRIKTVLYWRPIIEGYNTDAERMRRVLEMGNEYADAFVVSGLRGSAPVLAYLESLGVRMEGGPDPEHKAMPESAIERILELCARWGIKTPLFRGTSCAVSYLKGAPDYNAHWANPGKNCTTTCPALQKQTCSHAARPEKEKVERLLGRIGRTGSFEIFDRHVEVDDDLAQEEVTFLRHNLLFPVSLRR